MSEFHRMITYLYLYERNTKSRNVGFAKVEKRKQRCLLEIHMKNTGCSLTPVPVYFYVQKESQLAGIFLGNFTLARGSGDFKILLDAENLKDSGYDLENVKGIYIPLTEQMMLVSQWDDDDFQRENFMEIRETTTDASPSEESPQTLQVAENTAAATQQQESASSPETQVQTNPPQPKEPEEPIPTQEASLPPQTETASQQQESAKPVDALKAVEALPRPTEQTTGFHAVTEKETPPPKPNPRPAKYPDTEQPPGHSQADAPEDWDLRWRFILENYPVMTPFAGDENTLCVRMELKDLRQLPKQFWYLGNNSFLLHGFFNYRYFILGMTEEFGVKKWFIGVPGVFQNPERVMAALFGFPEFRSEKPSHINTGKFGYWYRYLNELSEPADNKPSPKDVP